MNETDEGFRDKGKNKGSNMSSNERSPITSHILDLAKGKAAANVPAVLEVETSGKWQEVSRSKTNQDGRIEDFLPAGSKANAGLYRIRFELDSYFGDTGFYPHAEVTFRLSNTNEHYHIPLLLSPFGFSTYRGT